MYFVRGNGKDEGCMDGWMVNFSLGCFIVDYNMFNLVKFKVICLFVVVMYFFVKRVFLFLWFLWKVVKDVILCNVYFLILLC